MFLIFNTLLHWLLLTFWNVNNNVFIRNWKFLVINEYFKVFLEFYWQIFYIVAESYKNCAKNLFSIYFQQNFTTFLKRSSHFCKFFTKSQENLFNFSRNSPNTFPKYLKIFLYKFYSQSILLEKFSNYILPNIAYKIFKNFIRSFHNFVELFLKF